MIRSVTGVQLNTGHNGGQELYTPENAFSICFGHVPKCPSSTNAVERKNKDCKSDKAPLKLAMISLYKLDKLACF